MNEIDRVRLKEAFLLLDEAHSGFITRDDVHLLIRALGFTPTENDLKKIDVEFHIDETIDYLRFIDIMSTISSTKYSYEQIENAFFAFDKNRYGLINVQEFRTAMTTFGEALSGNEMDEMMKDLPVDEDGFIEYENFCLQFKPKEDSIQVRQTIEEKQ